MDQKQVIAVDLNRTLAQGAGPDDFGEPTPGAAAAMQELQDRGYTICINSVVGDVPKIRAWLDEERIPFDYINESPAQPPGSSAKLNVGAMIDDRAVPYRGNWRQTLDDLYRSGVMDKRLVIAHPKALTFTIGGPVRREIDWKCGGEGGTPGPCPKPARGAAKPDKPAARESPASSAGPPRGAETPNADHPGAAHGSTVKVKATDKRAFDGKNPVETKVKLTKQETGRVGEAVVLAYLKQQGFKDARPMNTAATNFPVDMIEDHRPTEVKAGLVSNTRGAQQWRLTFSKESAAEKEAYDAMTPEQRGKWNEDKQRRIKQRKEAVIKELEKKTGKKINPRTMTTVINPDTKTADIYEFDGFHDRIDWQSDLAKAGYKGSVKYE